MHSSSRFAALLSSFGQGPSRRHVHAMPPATRATAANTHTHAEPTSDGSVSDTPPPVHNPTPSLLPGRISLASLLPVTNPLPSATHLAKALALSHLQLDGEDFIGDQARFSNYRSSLMAVEPRITPILQQSKAISIEALQAGYNPNEVASVYDILNDLLFNVITLTTKGDVAKYEVNAANGNGQAAYINLSTRVGLYGHRARLAARKKLVTLSYFAEGGIQGLRQAVEHFALVLPDDADHEQIRDALLSSIRPTPPGTPPVAPACLHATYDRLVSKNALTPLSYQEVLDEISVIAHS
ncbi:MAG: hypothetical protein ACO38I_11030, partial [Ilumatobacteraceae bacterium]